MDIERLLQGHCCSCGRTHTCAIRHVQIGKGAIAHLRTICADYTRVLLVADDNTFIAAGDKTVAALADKELRCMVFPGTQVLVPNEAAIDAVEVMLADAELIVGIGSGVIQDLCKYVSFDKKIPYVIVATAPSMDGYASNGAAMILGGMKVTVAAGLPLAIVADTAVLCDAPMDMIKAGYGDIIGKYSALNDWKLSQLVKDEYFCEEIYRMTYGQIERTRALADGILQRREDSVQALMEALVVIGILMSFAGSSRPASGSEHHLSHFFEITGLLAETPYLPHGLDVAYATVVTARLRERLLAAPFPEVSYRPAPRTLRAAMETVYGEVAEGCLALQKKVGHYTTDRTAVYHEKETAIRAVLAEMPRAHEIEAMLAQVGMSMEEFYAIYSDAHIRDAVKYAKDLKDRYTVLWMYYDLYGGEIDE